MLEQTCKLKRLKWFMASDTGTWLSTRRSLCDLSAGKLSLPLASWRKYKWFIVYCVLHAFGQVFNSTSMEEETNNMLVSSKSQEVNLTTEYPSVTKNDTCFNGQLLTALIVEGNV